MASKISQSQTLAGLAGGKLPMISAKGLVSPATTPRAPTLQDKSAEWAASIRLRLDKKIAEANRDEEEVELKAYVSDEISALGHEIVVLFVHALQKDDRHAWMFLKEAIVRVIPYKDLLSDNQEIFHYLERAHAHLEIHQERLFDLNVSDSLQKVFGKELERIASKSLRPKKVYCPPTPPRSLAPPVTRKLPVKVKTRDRKDPFTLERPDDITWQKPRLLTFGDLTTSMAEVAFETATREAIWNACLGTTALALNVDIPEDPKEVIPEQEEVEASEAGLEVCEEMTEISVEDEEYVSSPMSGREAVEHFSKCYHTGKIKHMYFNVAPNRLHRPYDLIAVPKSKINKEHYVFSTFGVLHVFPDQSSNNMSLADWQKEAVLFNAITHISFFKNFILRKIFKRWYTNIHFADFARVRQDVLAGLLPAVPSFGASLLQVSKLCNELLQLKLLPLDTDKTYELGQFENVLHCMNRQAEKILERFYRFNKIVVDTTAEESFKKLRHCDKQYRHKAYFSKDSLYLQRKKHEQRKANLLKAKEEAGRLGTFVKLVDQILLSHLIQCIRKNVFIFVNEALKLSATSSRDGFFRCALVFNGDGVLTISPSEEDFRKALTKVFVDLPGFICRAALPYDGSLTVRIPDDVLALDVMKDQLTPRTTSINHQTMMSLMKDPKKRKPNSSVFSSGDSASLKPAELILDEPVFSETRMPTKSEDVLGVATPDMMQQPTPDSELQIDAQNLLSQNKPLSSGNLKEKLLNDEQYWRSFTMQQNLMKEANEEIREFCQRNEWVNEIHQFCENWTENCVNQWEGEAAYAIEQKLNEIRQWIEKVRNFEKSYSTENGLFYVDCSGIPSGLIPKLNGIFKEMCSFIASEAWNLAKNFNSEMIGVLELLKKKETSVNEFAIFAKTVSVCKKSMPCYQQRMEYVKSLYEVIRMCFRAATSEEEAIEEKILAHWEAFLFHMQDAMEFVNTQTPVITQNLDEDYQKLEKRAKKICEEATGGQFLNPDKPPTKMLEAVNLLQREYHDIRDKLEQATRWREAITGEGYDLTSNKKMGVKIDLRQEVWKYFEVSAHTIKEWKQLPLEKLNARKAMTKIHEWLSIHERLKAQVTSGDAVLGAWFKLLNDFKEELPVLHKLTHDVLKPRHWKSIFLSIGEQYNAKNRFTVDELIAYRLSTHRQVVDTVYAAAISEYTIEVKLEKLKKLWDEKEFKLAKHIPDSMYTDGEGSKGSPKGRKGRRSEKVRHGGIGTSSSPKFLDLRNQDLFILIEIEEIRYLLEDSRVSVQTMLASPHVADHRAQVEKLCDSLTEIEEIVNLWSVAQNKWLYFLKIFEQTEMYCKMPSLAAKFEDIHCKFTEIMQAVVQEPRVMAMLNKHRGEKGYRVHQGQRLRLTFDALIAQEEELLSSMLHFLDGARNQFSRLYFLSDQDLVDMLCVSRNPKALLPFVCKCFAGVEQLHFTLPLEADNGNTALDFALNADKLEVTKVVGCAGEELQLHSQLTAATDAPNWMSSLEMLMKSTLQTLMESCLQARLDEPSIMKYELMEELNEREERERALKTGSRMRHSCSRPETCQISLAELRKDLDMSFRHWILRFPGQCVLIAEAVIWERNVFRALEKSDKAGLKNEGVLLNSRLDDYISILRENFTLSDDTRIRRRLHVLLASLVNQAVHHRDIVQNLLQNEDLSDGAFDWLKVLKHHMNINSILRAKTDTDDQQLHSGLRMTLSGSKVKAAVPRSAGFKREIPLDTFSSSRPGSAPGLGSGAGGASLHRSPTTICTGYQFGPCSVSQMGATFAYDYEYHGPGERLVFTPLTERAYLNLTMSLVSFQCGTLVGPVGTGKSETIKDLAKSMGRNLAIFNCTPDLPLSTMNQYLNGMIQSGAWGLFDDLHTLSQGVLSVFGQHVDYLSNAFRVLDHSSNNQYGIRGQPRFDKRVAPPSGEKRIRRNSLTTLHSLPMRTSGRASTGLERQATVPHGFNEEGLSTYFEDPWVKERERRHSIEREIEIKESEFYKTQRPPPLFYEQVVLSRKPKADFKDLVPSYVAYKPAFVGNVLFNGKLIKASAKYGCFMTLGVSSTHKASDIPLNLRVCMRPCSLVVPDLQVISEVILFYNGFQDYKNLSVKLTLLLDLIKVQIPGKRQYQMGLKTVMSLLHLSSEHLRLNLRQQTMQRHVEAASSSPEDKRTTPSPHSWDKGGEEEAIITSITTVLGSRMASPQDGATFKNLLRDVFPNSARPKSGVQKFNGTLVKAIEEQLRQENLIPTENLVNKILQLYSALELKQAVILVGPSGSGKTTLYQILAKVLNLLHNKQYEVAMETELVAERPVKPHSQQKVKPSSGAPPVIFKILHDSEELPEVALIDWQKMKTNGVLQSGFNDSINSRKVDTGVIFANALSTVELFGCYADQQQWKNGLLNKLFRNAHLQVSSAETVMEQFDERKNKMQIDPPDVIHKWVVLDGSVSPEWAEPLNTMLDDTLHLSLANGESIKLHDETSVLFELTDLSNCSPSTITRCSVVNCGDETVPWKVLIEAWGESAKHKYMINTSSLQVINGLVSSTFPPMLKFLCSESMTSLLHNADAQTRRANRTAAHVKEVLQFLSLFSALLQAHFLREKHEKEMVNPPPRNDDTLRNGSDSKNSGASLNRLEEFITNYIGRLRHLFAFAYVWSFGGDLHESRLERFDEFARETLKRAACPIELPADGSVFDFGVDAKAGVFYKWGSRQMERARNIPSSYVPVPELDRYNYLIDLLLTSETSVLLTGVAGVGKSSLVQFLVQGKHPFSRLSMSQSLTATMLQEAIATHLPDPKSKPLDGNRSKVKGHTLIFIEDLNTAAQTDAASASQPALEVLRQILDQSTFIDRERHVPVPVHDVSFIATATSPGSPGHGAACHVMSARLTRRFFSLNLMHPSDSTLVSIYGKRLLTWLEEFPAYSVDHPHEFSKAMVQGVLDMQSAVNERLLPKPSHPQCLFTLHNIGHVLEGIFLLSPRSKVKTKTRPRLGVSPRSESDDLTSRSESSVPSSLDLMTPTVAAATPMTRLIARLWCHEVTRVYADRLNTEEHQWFENILEEIVIRNFCTGRVLKEEPLTVIEDSKSSPRVESANADSAPKSTTSVDQLQVADEKEKEENEEEEEGGGGKDPPPQLPATEDTEPQTPAAKESMLSESVVSEALTSNITESESQLSDDSSSSSSDFSSDESSESDSYLSVSAMEVLKRQQSAKKKAVSPNGRMSRKVSFRAVADRERECFSGPLLSFDEIKNPKEHLKDIIFSKYIMRCHADKGRVAGEKGYAEHQVEQLTEALNTCLAQYNAQNKPMHLVFFREAVQHIARMTRVFAMPGAHALLLSNSSYVGRATNVRLAAHLANCKVYEPAVQTDCSEEENVRVVHDNMKRCSKASALHGKQVVLLVDVSLGTHVIHDVCAFMEEATCPGLYSAEEMRAISAQMTPGRVKTNSGEQIEASFTKYLQRVRQNLHIVMLLNCISPQGHKVRGHKVRGQQVSLYEVLQEFPGLLKSCCLVDMYEAWSQEAYIAMAECWLREPGQANKYPIQWRPDYASEQISLVATAMAYMHSTACAAVSRLMSHRNIDARYFYTPETFKEFTHLLRVLAGYITEKEMISIEKYNRGLQRINMAYDSIASYKRDVSNLAPKHENALERVKELVSCVEQKREEFIQALDRCKEQEASIQTMLAPLEKLRQEAQVVFDKVNPTYQAALLALRSLDVESIEVVKSFRCPPQKVLYVMQSVCLLFHVQPPTWENVRAMMIRDNFIEEMQFYDKDNMPESLFQQLGEFYNNPEFTPESVQSASYAAATLCQWVRAVYEYVQICRAVKPKMEELMQAEQQLNTAQAKLGSYRVQANQVKTDLEANIEEHRSAIKTVKAIEKLMGSIERKIAKASSLVDQMSAEHSLWKSRLKQSRNRIRSSPADALMTAACVCYHGPLDAKSRADLVADWLTCCESGNFEHRRPKHRKYVSAKRQEVSFSESLQSIAHDSEQRTSSAASGVHRSSIYDAASGEKLGRKFEEEEEEVPTTSSSARTAVSCSLLAVRENYSLQDVLSSFTEMRDWKLKDLPHDVHSLHNALIMRLSCHNRIHSWPLLIDPDHTAEMWVRTLQNNENVIQPAPFNELVDQGFDFEKSSDGENSLDYSANRGGSPSPFNFDDANLEDSFESPEDNLWVLSFNDPSLSVRLVEAIYHGVTLLITHVEQRNMPKQLLPLLRKQFRFTKDGRRTITLGETVIEVADGFALYFSCSIPLWLRGSGMQPLPHELLCPVDLSVSQEAVVDLLLKDIMAVEWPEFQGQSHSVESDLLLQKFALQNEQEKLLQQIIATPALLEDPTLLEKLLESQQTIQRHQMILDETDYIREQLHDKRHLYVPVAVHGAKLYEIIGRVSVLQAEYNVCFGSFRRLFQTTVLSRHRGKGIAGAPKARSQELIDATTSAVYEFASAMMFEQHGRLFALLIALESMRMSEKLSNQELGLFVNGVDTQGMENTLVFSDKPDWMSNKMWLDCAALENTSSVFKNLRESLVENWEQWHEYFQCKFNTMNPLPGVWIKSPSVFQICLLWRICAAHKLEEVSRALVEHELGNVIESSKNYDIHEAFKLSHKSTPVVFLMPSPPEINQSEDSCTIGVVLRNPLHEVHSLAKESGMEGRVHVVTCGVTGQMQEIEKALQECALSGYWLLLQNAHLAHESWSPNALSLLQSLMENQPYQRPLDLQLAALDDSIDSGQSETGDTARSSSTRLAPFKDDAFHKDFRLWVTTRVDVGRLLPGVIIQHGIKVSCEMVDNFADTLSKTYDSTVSLLQRMDHTTAKIEQPASEAVPISILHSLLLHSQLFHPSPFTHCYGWSSSDLLLFSELLRSVVLVSQSQTGASSLAKLIYSGHTIDPMDGARVEAICEALLRLSPILPVAGVAALLESLRLNDQSEMFHDKLTSLVEIPQHQLALPECAQVNLASVKSRNLVKNLVCVIGSPDLMRAPLEKSFLNAEAILSRLHSEMREWPACPSGSKNDAFYPMDLFYASEIETMQETLSHVETDVSYLLQVVRGELTSCPEALSDIAQLSVGLVPGSWHRLTFPTRMSVSEWAEETKARIQRLRGLFTEGAAAPVIYNVRDFARPDRFIQAVLQTFVRREFKVLQNCVIEVEVLPPGRMPTEAPKSGAYMSGLRLHNAFWDASKNSLSTTSTKVIHDDDDDLPVLWLRPTDKISLKRKRRPQDSGTSFYRCPIYRSSDAQFLAWTNIAGTLELPSRCKVELWRERKVFLSCD